MKKLFLAIIFSSLFLSLNLFVATNSFAQENSEGFIEVVPSGEKPNIHDNTTTTSAEINYELPYPGMLPDNPFYFLKMIRDQFVKAIINDPYNKAKFSLLTAQKRLYAGVLLVDKKKYDLAIDTIEKSNNYFDDAIKAIEQVKKSDPKSADVRPFLDQFRTVTLKHSQVLSQVKERFGKKYKERVERQEERVKEMRKRVERDLKSK